MPQDRGATRPRATVRGEQRGRIELEPARGIGGDVAARFRRLDPVRHPVQQPANLYVRARGGVPRKPREQIA